MKGRYAGRRMTIYGSIIPGAAVIARSALLTNNLSERAHQRLRVLDWHRNHGDNLSFTARHFGVHRRMLRQWQERLQRLGPVGLNDQSRKPHHFREPTVRREIAPDIIRLRKEFPTYSKYKLHVLLDRQGSPSTIARILKQRHLIGQRISQKRTRAMLRPKRRYPRGMRIHAPGEFIQMDTKHIMGVGGKKLYQFTAIDVLTKQRALSVYPSESSRNGALFLEECRERFPAGVGAVQTDNGAPFQKYFAKRCAELQIPHYFIMPRSPKQNSYVEASHGADEREFYQQGNRIIDLTLMRQRLVERERIWNTIRPHQALGYKTPDQYYAEIKDETLATKDTVILQT